MRLTSEGTRHVDSVVLLLLVALFLFVSPFTLWWASDGSLWYFPYLLWLALIVLTAVVQRRPGQHDL